MRRAHPFLLIGLLLVRHQWSFCAEDSLDLEVKGDEVIIVPKNAKSSDIPIKTTEIRSIMHRVDEALKDRPDGSRARVVLRRVFSNHPAHYGVQAYPHSVVPLNEKGEPDGLERIYGGGTFRIVPWKHGRRHGEEKVYAGQRVKAIIPWVNGKMHGVRKTFYPDGTVQVEAAYENGEANGPTRNYDPKGRLVREASLTNSKRHGLVRDFWPESGKVRREIRYNLGKVVGVAKDYYANGQLKRALPFKDNAMHGIEIQYEADGTVVRKRYWIKGETATEDDFEKGKDRS